MGRRRERGALSPTFEENTALAPADSDSTRTLKKVKLVGIVLTRDGSLKPHEFHGPRNILLWVYSYTVLQNVLVMLDAVDLGNLLQYKALIEGYQDRVF